MTTYGIVVDAPITPNTKHTVEEARSHPGQVAGKGIDDVVEHYAQIIGGLETLPVVIGHSFGGLIVQRLLGQDLAGAATTRSRRRSRDRPASCTISRQRSLTCGSSTTGATH